MENKKMGQSGLTLPHENLGRCFQIPRKKSAAGTRIDAIRWNIPQAVNIGAIFA